MNDVYDNNNSFVEKDSFMAKEITFYRLDDNASGFQVSVTKAKMSSFGIVFRTARQSYFHVLFKRCVVSKAKVWSKYKTKPGWRGGYSHKFRVGVCCPWS